MASEIDEGRSLHVKASFRLNSEWLRAIAGPDAGLALLRLQSGVEDSVRRIVRKQLRAILAEIGGDPWHYSVADHLSAKPLVEIQGSNVFRMEVNHGE